MQAAYTLELYLRFYIKFININRSNTYTGIAYVPTLSTFLLQESIGEGLWQVGAIQVGRVSWSQ